jgi:hypothetical protein
MLAFGNCKNYIDYLNKIKEAMVNGTHYYDSNESGLGVLTSIDDSKLQKKIITVFGMLDKELSTSSIHNDEMWKKIDYFLVLGNYISTFGDKFSELDERELCTLLLGEISSINDSNKPFIRLYSNKALLDCISNHKSEREALGDYSIMGLNDYFFMMDEHYEKAPFDLDDDNKCREFITRMIDLINSNSLHNGVMNMMEYWNSNDPIRETVLGGGPK